MGDNQAFSLFEATILACHNRGVLSKELLHDIIEPYRETDMDSGGMTGELSKDGHDVIDIVIIANGGMLPKRPELPSDYKDWTKEHDRLNDEWQEARWGEFNSIV